MDQHQLPPILTATEAPDREWFFPKIGLVAVGTISHAILGELAWRLPSLHRTMAIHTDANALRRIKADCKLWVSDGRAPPLTPQAAQLLAQTLMPDMAEAVAGLDMVLLVAGMGGPAGTGIAPVIAQVLREQKILTLAFTTLPFNFEGNRRHQNAQIGLQELGAQVNALLPVQNSDLERVVEENASLESVMNHAPLAFIQLCRSITNSVLVEHSNVCIDFEDLRHLILGQTGDCAFGFGAASGVNAADAAVQQAIHHVFLGQSRLQRASAVLVAIEATPDALSLRDVRSIMLSVGQQLPSAPPVIYSTVSATPEDGHDFRVSILASGIQRI